MRIHSIAPVINELIKSDLDASDKSTLAFYLGKHTWYGVEYVDVEVDRIKKDMNLPRFTEAIRWLENYLTIIKNIPEMVE